ncbi:YpzG family protein [Lysinibacillus endophyticus]|uniref:YpzG family protein n=1 Tax=Ureibacillus endophyticus TaxID=1978490 RepID=A0A494ZAS8_9BACL|nr:YpzG family protein [Lysinibacillus endophyticus]MCP1146375.1 YpzG family protein [Lysinibacillus endophyticus]RKQ19513.1 YpzG family protein [Lysinibacillus endophyticus]
MGSKKGILDPNSDKTHKNWEKPKFQKSQMNGETKITPHNERLRKGDFDARQL